MFLCHFYTVRYPYVCFHIKQTYLVHQYLDYWGAVAEKVFGRLQIAGHRSVSGIDVSGPSCQSLLLHLGPAPPTLSLRRQYPELGRSGVAVSLVDGLKCMGKALLSDLSQSSHLKRAGRGQARS